MAKTHFLLKDVARLLRLKPYKITYAISVGLVEEPKLRISNKRIFMAEDIERLAAHFGVELPVRAASRKKDLQTTREAGGGKQ
jgi:hypothetical protein